MMAIGIEFQVIKNLFWSLFTDSEGAVAFHQLPATRAYSSTV